MLKTRKYWPQGTTEPRLAWNTVSIWDAFDSNRGIPSGERHELCRGLHAEQNAIIQAAYHGVGIQGATLYCTNHPCIICSKMIINAGIKRIVYEEGYADTLAARC